MDLKELLFCLLSFFYIIWNILYPFPLPDWYPLHLRANQIIRVSTSFSTIDLNTLRLCFSWSLRSFAFTELLFHCRDIFSMCVCVVLG